MDTNENALSNTQCRLSLLNNDCLLKVLKFLDINDLMQLCKTDVYVKDFILKSFIGTKVFYLRRGFIRNSNYEILETFGKSMTKFTTYEFDFNGFLESVIKYCAPNKLTSVHISLFDYYNTRPEIVTLHNQRSMPYFSNLIKLTLRGEGHNFNKVVEKILNALSLAAKNLQRLEFYQLNAKGGWSTTSRMENLRELRIIESDIVKDDISDFKAYLYSLPKLEVFVYKGVPVDIADIGHTLINSCPDLKTFQYQIYYGVEEYPFDTINSFDFLASFSNLNTVGLNSFTYCSCDLYDVLIMLATTNIVKLKVFPNFNSSKVNNHVPDCRRRIMNSSFKGFLSLKVLELDITNRNYAVTDLHCEFLLHMASQLKNLVMFTLNSYEFSNAYKIIELLPQVRTFSIFRSYFKHTPVFMLKTVRHLRTVRQKQDTNNEINLVTLIVNELQWREFQVYKDIDKLAKIIIAPHVEPNIRKRLCNTKGDIIIY